MLPLSTSFLDCRGTLRKIRGVPLAFLLEYADLIELLETEFFDQTRSFPDLYSNSPYFRQLVDQCLVLNRLDPSWISLPRVERFFYQVEDGKLKPGVLHELNFPERPRKPGWDQPPITLPEYVNHLTVGIVTSGLEPSYSYALKLAETLTALEIEALIKERTAQINPEQVAQERQREYVESIDPSELMDFSGFQMPVDTNASQIRFDQL